MTDEIKAGDGMKLLPWKDWNGAPVSEAHRDAMAREILRDRGRGLRTTSVHTGDTLIYFAGWDEDGEGEILDCIVRRKARVTGTPAPGRGDGMRYTEQPAWVWRDGVPYILLPMRAVDTEWLPRWRYVPGVHFRLDAERVPAGATREVRMGLWRPGMEWCAQERPAPERRSGKDRRKPTVTISSQSVTAASIGDWVASAGMFTGEAR